LGARVRSVLFCELVVGGGVFFGPLEEHLADFVVLLADGVDAALGEGAEASPLGLLDGGLLEGSGLLLRFRRLGHLSARDVVTDRLSRKKGEKNMSHGVDRSTTHRRGTRRGERDDRDRGGGRGKHVFYDDMCLRGRKGVSRGRRRRHIDGEHVETYETHLLDSSYNQYTI